jgi:hypothetical protein
MEAKRTDFDHIRQHVNKVETSYGIPENRTMSFSQFPLLENINNRLSSSSVNTSLPSGNMSQPDINTHFLSLV